MNDIEFIERTLQAVFSQNFQDFELVNVDSGSTDGTYEIIKKYNSGKVYQIKPEEYVPGIVLNDAISKCDGEIIVFNNSDCIPQNQEWLNKLIEPLLKQDNIAAVYGNQIPRPDARILVVKDYSRAFGNGELAAQWEHFFSLATSAAPKELLLKEPFAEDLQYSEDIEWSYRMKNLGYEIVYARDAIVEHSHNYSLREVRKRFYNEGLAEGRIYGTPQSFFRGFLLPCAVEMSRDILYLLGKGKVFTVPYGCIYRFMQRLFVWKGRRNYTRNKAAE
jgi:rhamnosyltransferase